MPRRRVPVDLVLHALERSGLVTNARTVRNWRLRGHITHTEEGYDLVEVMAYVDRRADLRGKLKSCLFP